MLRSQWDSARWSREFAHLDDRLCKNPSEICGTTIAQRFVNVCVWNVLHAGRD